MQRTHTIIIGAGQAGLALSRCLTAAGRDHVVFDRGRLGERWRTERWDSLRLLTPNWMTDLPAWRYTGNDPDGFMAAGELVRHFERYAESFRAPVQEHTTVISVRASDDGYRVDTTQESWSAQNVVIATGVEGYVHVPSASEALALSIRQLPSNHYHRPDDVAAGAVLIVGASATGIQLADELTRAGRHVLLAVGNHTRMPRRYRGRDIFWWLQHIGMLDTTIDQMPDRVAARRVPSMQLVGRPDHAQLDLGVLQHRGVELAGALRDIDGTRVRFADGLAVSIAASERRMHRTLDRIDRVVDAKGTSHDVAPPDRPAPIAVPATQADVDLRASGFETVIWATGFARSYSWLHVPVLGDDGEIRHQRGVTAAAGLYVLGQRFQHFRNSNFIGGVGRDAAFIAHHIAARHASRTEAAA